ncbi:MAG TPA: FHA domain-containing protein [Mycobacteriales bacterium]|nr:FHA domain-containing protein [Mycobacteriales bacterium]
MAETPPPQSGRPRLVVATGGHASAGSPAARGEEVAYLLTGKRVTIGSAADQDISLHGLAPQHAVVEWLSDGDEYVFHALRADGSALMNSQIRETGLHHGDRIELGEWTLVFQRDEHADHIRRGRARQGGQYAGGGITSSGGHLSEGS